MLTTGGMLRGVVFDMPRRYWVCPKCGAEDVTREAQPHSRFHSCPALGGLTAPMLPRGLNADVRVHEREDYVGTEDVPLVDGRPISAVEVVRDDGNDVTVYAPTAYASGQGSI